MPEIFTNTQENIKLLIIYIYFLVVNLSGFILIKSDKKRAVKKMYRIPEKIIFIIAFLGGSIGIYFSMYKYRHKTLHKRFTLGILLISLMHFIMLLMVFRM